MSWVGLAAIIVDGVIAAVEAGRISPEDAARIFAKMDELQSERHAKADKLDDVLDGD